MNEKHLSNKMFLWKKVKQEDPPKIFYTVYIYTHHMHNFKSLLCVCIQDDHVLDVKTSREGKFKLEIVFLRCWFERAV